MRSPTVHAARTPDGQSQTPSSTLTQSRWRSGHAQRRLRGLGFGSRAPGLPEWSSRGDKGLGRSGPWAGFEGRAFFRVSTNPSRNPSSSRGRAVTCAAAAAAVFPITNPWGIWAALTLAGAGEPYVRYPNPNHTHATLRGTRFPNPKPEPSFEQLCTRSPNTLAKPLHVPIIL